MPPHDGSLWDLIVAGGDLAERILHGVDERVALSQLGVGSALDHPLDALAGASVMVHTADQLTAALAMIELDGIARRLVLCPPGVAAEHLPIIAETAEIDTVVFDDAGGMPGVAGETRAVRCSARMTTKAAPDRTPRCTTEWILLTSGTTGVPKLVVHTLASLVGAIKPNSDTPTDRGVWSTFYDIRRYGGMQIFFRGLLGGGSLVLSSPHEATPDFLARAGRHGVTQISGTPSHWRRALMSPAAGRIAPRYVRMSGEIADQTIIDDLRRFYRTAVAHAFATTEAGVGFAVNDGRAGFPADFIGRTGVEVELQVADETLRIRSPLTAARYLGDTAPPLRGQDGFVDTGDVVELRDGRYFFVGRRGGIINVGGLKVHPEEVEAIINRHPAVQMSLVKPRKNPFTGAIVVADIVVRPELADEASPTLQSDILAACRRDLAAHKVPAAIRFVTSLDVGAAGKLARRNA